MKEGLNKSTSDQTDANINEQQKPLAKFLTLYKTDTDSALKWIKENESQVTTLFTSQSEMIQFAQLIEQKRPKITDGLNAETYRVKLSEIRGLISRLSTDQMAKLYKNHTQYIELIKCSSFLASELFDKAPDLLGSLFQTYEQFMELQNASDPIANALFKKEPSRIAALFATQEQLVNVVTKSSYLGLDLLEKEPEWITTVFATYSQFMKLLDANHLLASALFKKEIGRIGSLFTNHTQFMRLEDKSHSLACELFKHDSARISALFVTHDQFMQLEDKSHSLACDVFKQDSARISALFVTHAQFMQLENTSHSLACDLLKKFPDRIAALFDTEEKFNELKECNSTLAKEISQIRKDTPFVMTVKKETSIQQDSSAHFHYSPPANTTPENIPETNYTFLYKCLTGLAAVGGFIMFIIGVLVAQPDATLLGAIITGASAYSLYGLFSNKPSGHSTDPQDFTSEMSFDEYGSMP